MRDKPLLKEWDYDPKERLVRHPVAYGRLMNMPQLRVFDVESGVWSRYPRTVCESSMEREYIVFQCKREFLHIGITVLATFEFAPREK